MTISVAKLILRKHVRQMAQPINPKQALSSPALTSPMIIFFCRTFDRNFDFNFQLVLSDEVTTISNKIISLYVIRHLCNLQCLSKFTISYCRTRDHVLNIKELMSIIRALYKLKMQLKILTRHLSFI